MTEARYGEWRPIETAPTGQLVLIAFKNSAGHWRRVKAIQIAPKTVETNVDSDWFEYDEPSDTFWTPAGWYEDVEAETGLDYSLIHLSGVAPSHWTPLPAPPEEVSPTENTQSP